MIYDFTAAKLQHFFDTTKYFCIIFAKKNCLEILLPHKPDPLNGGCLP